jgi:hypothetical protein
VGSLALALGLGLLVLGAAPPAAAVARGRLAPFALALWVLAFGELVLLSLALSLFDALTRPWLLVACGLAGAVSLAAGRRGGVRPPSLAHAREALAEIAADPLLVVLAAGALLALGYSAALAVFTAPTEHDALTYHLLRAAYWKQEHGVGWIDAPVDPRANSNPPVAEIGVADTMILAQGDRYVALPQLTALAACVVGVFALGRRIGLDRRGSAFGALLVAFLPVALVQSSTAMNDVVPAAFAVAVAVFGLGRGRGGLALAALALALMVGTKTPALLAVPALALVIAAGQPVRRWAALAAVGLLAMLVGGAWLAETHDRTGSFTAGALDEQGSSSPFDLVLALARFTRYLTSAIEVPGVGRDQGLYVLAGAALVLAGVVARHRQVLVAGLVVALVPTLVPFRGLANEVYKRGWWTLGRHDLSYLDVGDRNGTLVQAGYSWYGPVALALAACALVVVLAGRGTRVSGWVPRMLALAPVTMLVTLAIVLAWSPVYGRLVLPGVVLGAATWGCVYPIRWAAIAAVATSLVVGLTSFWWFDVKQVGVRLLEPPHEQSGWTKSRWQLQDYENGVAPFLAFVDRTVPDDASISVDRPGPVPYSVLGPGLRRTVTLVDAESRVVPGDWFLGPTGSYPRCGRDWTPVAGPPGPYWLLRRSGETCPT